jgi:hypothetical protein
MRIVVLLSSIVAAVIEAGAQTTPAKPPAQPQTGTTQTTPAKPPAQPQTGTTQTTPAPAPQTRKPATTASTRSGMVITVADPRGVVLSGVRVEAMGPTLRDGMTNGSGQVPFPSIMPGVYRLRFSGDGWIMFEREVTLRAGQVADVDVTLNPAPKPPPAPEPVPQPVVEAPAAQGPKGETQVIGIEGLLEKEFIGKEARRESLLSCSGSERATMIQLNGPMPERLYESGDAVYYVLGGDGAATIDGRRSPIKTNDFVSVPRGTAHGFDRTGKRALVLLAILSGEPCERAR